MTTVTSWNGSSALTAYARKRPAAVVGWISALLSVVFATAIYVAGETLLNFDSVSHLQIARRVVDSTSPGLAQLGGVWLPLPHLLMVPLAWIDSLYYSGWAGTIVSMVSYVASSMLVYAVVRDLTDSRAAAAAGAAVFMLNPNVLYMQSTPMTELPLFIGLLGMVYGMQRYIRTERHGYLLVSAAAAMLATLTRYEAWILVAGLLVVLLIASWRRGFDRARIEGTTIAFATLGLAGIAGWMVWNQAIFGSALNFQSGDYAKPSLWVEGGEPAIGNMWIAFYSYASAVVDNVGIVTVVLAVAGAIVLVAGRRFDLRLLPATALLGFFPFFVLALYLGQRPLHVTQVHGALYNVRFGLVMILPAAIFVGYLARALADRLDRPHARAWTVSAIVAVTLLTSALTVPSAVTRQESLDSGASTAQQHSTEAATFLRERWTGGLVLAESFGNTSMLFESRVDPGAQVYEGSYRQWEPALADPAAADIDWIVMRTTPDAPDLVAQKLSRTSELSDYTLIFRNDRYDIYERNS